MTTTPAPLSVNYLGIEETHPRESWTRKRPPTIADYSIYKIGDRWVDKLNLTYWVLANKAQGIATWIMLGGGGSPLNTLTGDDNTPVVPVANNINVQGGAAGAIAFTTSGPGQLDAQVLTDGVTITIVGGALTTVGGMGANSFVTDAGAAAPVAGVINILGTASQGISTSGAGNTVTLTVADATTTTKGVASFNTNDFTVAAGAVSLKNTPLPALFYSLTTVGAVTASTVDIPIPNNQVSQVITNIAYVDSGITVGGGVLLSSAILEQAGVFNLLNVLDELSINESPALAASNYEYITGGAASTFKVRVTGVAGFTINWRVAVTIISTP